MYVSVNGEMYIRINDLSHIGCVVVFFEVYFLLRRFECPKKRICHAEILNYFDYYVAKLLILFVREENILVNK